MARHLQRSLTSLTSRETGKGFQTARTRRPRIIPLPRQPRFAHLAFHSPPVTSSCTRRKTGSILCLIPAIDALLLGMHDHHVVFLAVFPEGCWSHWIAYSSSVKRAVPPVA